MYMYVGGMKYSLVVSVVNCQPWGWGYNFLQGSKGTMLCWDFGLTGINYTEMVYNECTGLTLEDEMAP